MLNHEEGINLHYKLKNQFEIEIEFLCLNEEFMDKEQLLSKLDIYQKISYNYPSSSILKESEMHDENKLYYEMSIYTSLSEVDAILYDLENNYSIHIDIIHYDNDEYSLEEFRDLELNNLKYLI